MKKIIGVTIVLTACFASTVPAADGTVTISDKEIIESLSELKSGQMVLNQRIDDVNRRFDDVNQRFDDVNQRFDDVNRRFDDVNRRFDDFNSSINQRIDDLKDEMNNLRIFMLWGFGIIFGGIGGLITIVIWDRRTAISPVVKKSKELEERGEQIEKILKEYAKADPKLEEILKSYGMS